MSFLLSSLIIIFRTKEVECVPFLTTRMVDEVASHLRIYQKTRTRLNEQKKQSGNINIKNIFYLGSKHVLLVNLKPFPANTF